MPSPKTNILPDRAQWARCLLTVDDQRLQEVAQDLSRRYRVVHHQRPQAGLTMLSLREANRGEEFHLGELPMTSAAVKLYDAQHNEFQGAAVMMHHDEDAAIAVAIIDAALHASLPGSDTARDLVAAGWQAVCAEAKVRHGLLQQTTVDFQLLESEEDDDDA